jgi:DNA-binding response OmpR family regulator
MSGYAAPIISSQGLVEADVTVLGKPFTAPELLAAIRATLARRDAPVPAASRPNAVPVRPGCPRAA